MGLLSLENTLQGYGYNSNIDSTDDNLQLASRNGVPYLEVSSTHLVMTFHEALQIATWVRNALNCMIHLDRLTGNSIAFYVFDPSGTYSLAQLGQGTSLPTWLNEVDDRPDEDLPLRPLSRCPADVLPSQADDFYGFLWERPNDAFYSDEYSGKWCVMRPITEIDALWVRVRDAVRAGVFPAALVSTPSQAMGHGGTFVICIFTKDWRDREEVNAARDVLRSYGVTEEIGYKRDIETVNNVYGVPEEWFYRA